MIHPTASVHPEAVIGSGVVIGEFCIVDAGARIGDRTRILGHAIVRGGTVIGVDSVIHSFAVVGGEAQMRVADPTQEPGIVKIGDRTVLREFVTVNRPTKSGNTTEVGNDCFLMANTHVGHDTHIGNFVTTANNVMLAGHVHVGDHTFVGGGAGVHQFVRLGEGAMIAGNAAISYDVPPYSTAVDRNDIVGLNLVGIRRREFAPDVLPDLKRCFRAVFFGNGNLRDAAAAALASGEVGRTPPGQAFLAFFAGGKRGFAQARSRHRGVRTED